MIPSTEMEYTGKYARMAERFRADGCDNAMIERFVQEEMEADAFRVGEGTTDLDAFRKWMEIPENIREKNYLHKAFCRNCGISSFAGGYNVRQDRYGLILEGNCAKCGAKVARTVD